MGYYNSKDAAEMLGVSIKTFNKLVKQAGIVRADDPRDHRAQLIDQQQYEVLAGMLKRPPEKKPDEIEQLRRDVDNLKQRVTRIEQIPEILAVKSLISADDGQAGVPGGFMRRLPMDTVSPDDGAIRALLSDAQSAVFRMIQFLEDNAYHLKAPHAGQVVITSQSETDIFDLVPILRSLWHRALRKVLNQGWDIIHLIPRDDKDKLLIVAENLAALLGTRGNYVPTYFTQESAGPLPREFIVIPDTAMLVLSATASSRYTDRVTIHQWGDSCTDLVSQIERLRLKSAEVLKTYPRLSAAFSKAIARTEREPGHLGLYMNGFSERTIPMEIHRERIDPLISRSQSGGEAQRLRDILESREKRRAAFERTVRTYLVQDICPLHAIENYLTTGIYSPDDLLLRPSIGGARLTPEQIEEHLRHVIYLLRHFRNYRLGILDSTTTKMIPQTYWMVKSGYNLMIETWGHDSGGVRGEFDIEVKEPPIVEVFWDYFARLWDSLPDANKDKDRVIPLLEGMIPRIRRE